MRFTVTWSEDGEADLAQAWLDANSALRPDTNTNTAADVCDRTLARDAHLVGESRERGRRVVFIWPLVIHYEVIMDDRLARVLGVHHAAHGGRPDNGQSS